MMVLLGVVLRFYQQMRADNAAEKLKAMVSNTATLVRGGKESEVPLKMLVPADVRVLLARSYQTLGIGRIHSRTSRGRSHWPLWSRGQGLYSFHSSESPLSPSDDATLAESRHWSDTRALWQERAGQSCRQCTEKEDATDRVERQVGKSAAALLLESRIGEQFLLNNIACPNDAIDHFLQ